MKANFKKLFKILFLVVSAIVFLFVFFPERRQARKGKRKAKVVEKKRQSILKKRVYYTKENLADEDCFEEIEEFEDVKE